jgi:hypothetical protein
MVNKSKIKGTRAESAIVTYLQANGHPNAERRALAGTADRGDIAGVIENVIESKDHASMSLGAWIDEVEVETRNARARWGVVWHKRRGRASPGDWFVTMTGAQWTRVLRTLGYGEPL